MNAELTTPALPHTSSTRIAIEAAKQTGSLFVPVLKRAWGWILILHIVQIAAGELSSYASDYLRSTGREDLGFLIAIAGLDMIFTLIWSAFWALAVSLAADGVIANPIRPESTEESATTVNRILIEEIRSLASIIWRIPLLIVPAGIEWVRLSLVPLVVIFDPAYRRGNRDALKRSRDLSRRHFWLLNIYLLASAVVPALIEHFVQSGDEWIWQNPVGVTVSAVLTFFVNVASGIYLYSLYRRLTSAQDTEQEALDAAI